MAAPPVSSAVANPSSAPTTSSSLSSSAAAAAGAGPSSAAHSSSAAAAVAGVSAGCVFVKRAGDARARFAPVEILVGDAVGHLAERATLKLGWGVSAAYVDLFLVPAESEDAIAAGADGSEGLVLATRPLSSIKALSAVGISDRCCVLARLLDPPAAAPGGGGAHVNAEELARALQTIQIHDTSAEYARALIGGEHAADIVSGVDGFRRELSAKLPGPIFVHGHVEFASQAAGLLPLAPMVGGSSVESIADIFQQAFYLVVRDGTEEVWATTAGRLTGYVLTLLSEMTGERMSSDRNAVDHSNVTMPKLRPDYCLWASDALLLKAEHKQSPSELGAAKGELVSKMAGWNTIALRGLPFLPCFAVGGERLQFCAIFCDRSGACALAEVSEIFNMRVPLQRVAIVRASFNLFRVIVALRRRMPAYVPPLYKKQPRLEGFVEVRDDHVRKVCRAAPDAVYACLSGAQRIPSAVSVEVLRPQRPRSDGLVELRIEPVCLEVTPSSESELRNAIRAVLRALDALHTRGFVHRDIRWPNVLQNAAGEWLLADFELADVAESPLPEQFRAAASVPADARRGGPWVPACDLWQLGRLVLAWERADGARVLSGPGASFAAQLAGEEAASGPISSAAARELAWLR